MIISNCCILPEGWTIDTFMEPHNFRPYNPDIANVFYRAGYIERWGRGIQKICDACKELGAEPPVYELLGNGLRVHFKALESAIIDDSKTPNRHNGGLSGGIDGGLEERIISLIRRDRTITVLEISDELEMSKRTVEREMKKLRDSNRIGRVGGNRYGHWEINE